MPSRSCPTWIPASANEAGRVSHSPQLLHLVSHDPMRPLAAARRLERVLCLSRRSTRRDPCGRGSARDSVRFRHDRASCPPWPLDRARHRTHRREISGGLSGGRAANPFSQRSGNRLGGRARLNSVLLRLRRRGQILLAPEDGNWGNRPGGCPRCSEGRILGGGRRVQRRATRGSPHAALRSGAPHSPAVLKARSAPPARAGRGLPEESGLGWMSQGLSPIS